MISFVYPVAHSQPILDSGDTKIFLDFFCKIQKDTSCTQNKQIYIGLPGNHMECLEWSVPQPGSITAASIRVICAQPPACVKTSCMH